MTQNRFKILLLIFSAFLLLESCRKEELYPEVQFDFNLLDSEGNSKIVFNEGENFTFQFRISTNDPDWKLYDFENPDSDFFRVFKIDGSNLTDMGKPYRSFGCQTIYAACGYNMPYNFQIPWVTGLDESTLMNQNIHPPFCLFSETDYLPKGKYLTRFNTQFIFVKCDLSNEPDWNQQYYTTESIEFKIEFEIK